MSARLTGRKASRDGRPLVPGQCAGAAPAARLGACWADGFADGLDDGLAGVLPGAGLWPLAWCLGMLLAFVDVDCVKAYVILRFVFESKGGLRLRNIWFEASKGVVVRMLLTMRIRYSGAGRRRAKSPRGRCARRPGDVYGRAVHAAGGRCLAICDAPGFVIGRLRPAGPAHPGLHAVTTAPQCKGRECRAWARCSRGP